MISIRCTILMFLSFFISTNSVCQYYLAIPSDKTIEILSPKDNWKNIKMLKGHTNYVSSIAFDPDGQYLASGDNDGTIKIWDIKRNWKNIKTLRLKDFYSHHKYPVNSIAFSLDSQYLAAGDDDGTIKIWDIKNNWKNIKTTGHDKGITSVAFSNQYFAFCSKSKNEIISIFDIKNNWEKELGLGYNHIIQSIAFSPNEQYLIVLRDGIKMRNLKGDRKIIKELGLWTPPILSMALNPNGRYLASGSYKTIRIWDAKKCWKNIKTLKGHTSWITSIAFSPDGRYLASGSDKTLKIKIWDIKNNWKDIKTFKQYSDLRTIAFSQLLFKKTELEIQDLEERILFIREHLQVMQEFITIRFKDGKKLNVPLSSLPKTVASSEILRALFANRMKKYKKIKKDSKEAAKISDEMQILQESLDLKIKEKEGKSGIEIEKIEKQIIEILDKLSELSSEMIGELIIDIEKKHSELEKLEKEKKE